MKRSSAPPLPKMRPDDLDAWVAKMRALGVRTLTMPHLGLDLDQLPEHPPAFSFEAKPAEEVPEPLPGMCRQCGQNKPSGMVAGLCRECTAKTWNESLQ